MALYDDPRHTLKPLIASDSPSKAPQLIAAAAAFLLKRRDQKMSRLAEFANWLYLQGKTTETIARTNALMQSLIAELEMQGWEELAMDLQLARLGGGPSNGAAKERWANKATYMWVVCAYYRHVGSSDALSVNYAKGLIERCFEHYHALRASPERDRALDARPTNEIALIDSILTQAFECAPETDSTLKGWLQRLIERSLSDDSAKETLIDCLRLLRHATDGAKWQHEAHADGTEPAKPVRTEALDTRYVPGASAFTMRFYRRHADVVHAVMEAEGKLASDWERAAEKTASWLWEHAERLTAETRRKLAEMRENPRWLVRPNMLDRVEIRVPLLREIGIRSIAFGIEGSVFPDVKVRVLVEQERRLNVYDTTIEGVQTMDPEVVFTGRKIDTDDILRFALWLIAVDALHGIVVNDRSAKKKRKVDGDAGKDDGQPLGPIIRRAHRRVLPEGHKASEAALALMQEAFRCTFGPGITFVQAVKPDGDNAAERSAAPIATYRHADLLALLPKPTDV